MAVLTIMVKTHGCKALVLILQVYNTRKFLLKFFGKLSALSMACNYNTVQMAEAAGK